MGRLLGSSRACGDPRHPQNCQVHAAAPPGGSMYLAILGVGWAGAARVPSWPQVPAGWMHHLSMQMHIQGSTMAGTSSILLTSTARLAQSAERKALNLVVVGSSPTVGVCSWS